MKEQQLKTEQPVRNHLLEATIEQTLNDTISALVDEAFPLNYKSSIALLKIAIAFLDKGEIISETEIKEYAPGLNFYNEICKMLQVIMSNSFTLDCSEAIVRKAIIEYLQSAIEYLKDLQSKIEKNDFSNLEEANKHQLHIKYNEAKNDNTKLALVAEYKKQKAAELQNIIVKAARIGNLRFNVEVRPIVTQGLITQEQVSKFSDDHLEVYDSYLYNDINLDLPPDMKKSIQSLIALFKIAQERTAIEELAQIPVIYITSLINNKPLQGLLDKEILSFNDLIKYPDILDLDPLLLKLSIKHIKTVNLLPCLRVTKIDKFALITKLCEPGKDIQVQEYLELINTKDIVSDEQLFGQIWDQLTKHKISKKFLTEVPIPSKSRMRMNLIVNIINNNPLLTSTILNTFSIDEDSYRLLLCKPQIIQNFQAFSSIFNIVKNDLHPLSLKHILLEEDVNQNATIFNMVFVLAKSKLESDNLKYILLHENAAINNTEITKQLFDQLRHELERTDYKKLLLTKKVLSNLKLFNYIFDEVKSNLNCDDYGTLLCEKFICNDDNTFNKLFELGKEGLDDYVYFPLLKGLAKLKKIELFDMVFALGKVKLDESQNKYYPKIVCLLVDLSIINVERFKFTFQQLKEKLTIKNWGLCLQYMLMQDSAMVPMVLQEAREKFNIKDFKHLLQIFAKNDMDIKRFQSLINYFSNDNKVYVQNNNENIMILRPLAEPLPHNNNAVHYPKIMTLGVLAAIIGGAAILCNTVLSSNNNSITETNLDEIVPIIKEFMFNLTQSVVEIAGRAR